MEAEPQTLRRRIADAEPDAGERSRYGDELRRAVIEYAVRREENGDSESEVVRELGLTQRTLWGMASVPPRSGCEASRTRGYQPRRNVHDPLRKLRGDLIAGKVTHIYEVDIKSFFD